jgi:ribosomal protein L9
MKVILQKPVDKLGAPGDVVEVAAPRGTTKFKILEIKAA